jgi:glycosyltransferase involved in cell wall biosynthesis
VPQKKVAFVPNPVDEVYFQRSKKHASSTQKIKIGIVARWDPIKNHEAVLQLAKEVEKQGLPWEFYSVTTIHKGYPWYKDMEQEYPKYIKVLQPMVPAQLKKFYQDMDILILPSRFDVSPTVVMEAMMQHRTTLISSSVGLVDVYRDCGASDLVVNFKHPSTVISAIQKYAKKDPPARLYRYVKKHYNGESVYRAYMKIARSLTTQR